MKTLVPFPVKTPYPRELRLWEPAGSPRAVLLISHGMAEQIDRYDRLAQRLNQEGILVAGYNHLGHGAEAPLLGWFAAQDGWGQAVADLQTVMSWLASRHPGLPRVLLGHSMGSFLAREYALRDPTGLDALVLCGTGWYPNALTMPALTLARIQKKLGRDREQSKLLDKLAFSRHNKPFKKDGITPFDWLSRDGEEVRKYVEDPYCGFVFTAGGFYDLFSGLKALAHLPRLKALPASLPIYLIAGDKDPVGAFGAGVKTVAQQYRDAGVQDVQIKLYDGARHELFNETNREQVMDDLAAWLESQLSSTERSP